MQYTGALSVIGEEKSGQDTDRETIVSNLDKILMNLT